MLYYVIFLIIIVRIVPCPIFEIFLGCISRTLDILSNPAYYNEIGDNEWTKES